MNLLNKNYVAAGIAPHIGGLALLGLRSKACETLQGYWSISCGMINRDESPKQAALREFFEETGLEISKDISFLNEFPLDSENYFIAFSLELNDLIFPRHDAIDAFEHEEWGFFKIEENTLPEPMAEDMKATLLKIK